MTGAHTPAWCSVGRFAAVSFPAMAYRVRWWWLATAAGTLLVAFVIGWWIARSPSVQASLLPPDGRQAASEQSVPELLLAVRGHLFRGGRLDAQRLCRRTVADLRDPAGRADPVLLFENALNIGADGGFMFAHGRGVEFFALILPHGMLELSAVFLGAAAGLRLGWKIIDPGPLTRDQALARAGRETVTLAVGMVVMLLTSGVIEAFVTPSPLPTWARIGIGACAEAVFLCYVIVLGRRATRAGLSPDIEAAPEVVPVAG